MNAARQRLYSWFIELKGDISLANQVVARFLREEVESPSCCEVKCGDGQYRKLWLCKDGEQARQLWNSRNSLGIKIAVWVKEGNGQIRKFVLWGMKKPKRARR